jgi:hypothetical protein
MTLATAAIERVLELLAANGVDATADAGALTPDPIGVLVGLPALTGRTLAGAHYTVPVTVVTGDPLSTLAARDRLYDTADAAADAIGAATYSPSSFSNGVNAEPLPSLELVANVSLSRLYTEVITHAPD